MDIEDFDGIEGIEVDRDKLTTNIVYDNTFVQEDLSLRLTIERIEAEGLDSFEGCLHKRKEATEVFIGGWDRSIQLSMTNPYMLHNRHEQTGHLRNSVKQGRLEIFFSLSIL